MGSVIEAWTKKYGKEKADKMWADANKRRREACKKIWTKEKRKEKSKQNIGKNNPMYGRTPYDVWVQKHGKDEADKLQKKHIENISKASKEMWKNDEYRNKVISSNTGKKRSKEFRENQRQAAIKQMKDPVQRELRSRAIRESYAKGTHSADIICSNQYGNRGFWNDHFYASEIELSRMKFLTKENIKWKRYVVGDLPFKFKYEYENVEHIYLPDFIIENDDGTLIVEEIKQSESGLTAKDLAKIECGKKTCTDHGVQYRVVYKNEVETV